MLTETNTTGQRRVSRSRADERLGVQWCTIPVAGATNRYQLYRENDPDDTCDGGGSTFMVDYLTAPTSGRARRASTGQYPTVEVTMPVDVDPSKRPGTYTLSDQIALRNGDICN